MMLSSLTVASFLPANDWLICFCSWSIRPCSLQSYSLFPTRMMNPLLMDASSLPTILISGLLHSFARNNRIRSICSGVGGVTYVSSACASTFSGVFVSSMYACSISSNNPKSPLSHNTFKKFRISFGNTRSITRCFFSNDTVGSSNSTPICGTASKISFTLCRFDFAFSTSFKSAA